MKTCAECGKEFKPRHFNDKLCSPECKEEWRRRKQRESSVRARAKRPRKPAPSMTPRPCEVCGEIFKPGAPNQRACSKIECRRVIGGALTVDTEIECAICGKTFLARAGSHRRTCGSQACAFRLNSQTQIANRAREKQGPRPVAPWMHPMDCPWETGKLDTLPPGVASWDCPEMDPMSGGFPMIIFNAPVAQEVAA